MQPYATIYNNTSIQISDIPILSYKEFSKELLSFMAVKNNHCLNYYCVKTDSKYQFYCFVANDISHEIYVLSHEIAISTEVVFESLTPQCFALGIFEREIHENFGIQFKSHPWLKPVRYSASRANMNDLIINYPFYTIDSADLHQVGVGPIHAGVIEPGHFRFICHGEKVLHLEIQLGYQHRGVEQLFIEKKHLLHKAVLAENIAGDTTVGHALAYTSIIETLSDFQASEQLQVERFIALELERIAMHIADTSALCADVAYQFGQVVNEALRTLVINTSQLWCGNRFAKGLIRPMGSHYSISPELAGKMIKILSETEARFIEITDRIYSLASVLDRFESVGQLTEKQANLIGAVGLAARHTGIHRDIRLTHPFGYYTSIKCDPVILHEGDVWARGMLRKLEAQKSFTMVIKALEKIQKCENVIPAVPNFNVKLRPSALTVSLVEGWRGEICHSTITNNSGEISHYKVKDPSMHNWLALALVMRNQEISDFPICNKSFNLSYCGHDL
jgi:Ni,Fe-hydrogenase III large subunit